MVGRAWMVRAGNTGAQSRDRHRIGAGLVGCSAMFGWPAICVAYPFRRRQNAT